MVRTFFNKIAGVFSPDKIQDCF